MTLSPNWPPHLIPGMISRQHRSLRTTGIDAPRQHQVLSEEQIETLQAELAKAAKAGGAKTCNRFDCLGEETWAMHPLFRPTKDDDPIEVKRAPEPSEAFLGWFDKPARTQRALGGQRARSDPTKIKAVAKTSPTARSMAWHTPKVSPRPQVPAESRYPSGPAVRAGPGH